MNETMCELFDYLTQTSETVVFNEDLENNVQTMIEWFEKNERVI